MVFKEKYNKILNIALKQDKELKEKMEFMFVLMPKSICDMCANNEEFEKILLNGDRFYSLFNSYIAGNRHTRFTIIDGLTENNYELKFLDIDQYNIDNLQNFEDLRQVNEGDKLNIFSLKIYHDEDIEYFTYTLNLYKLNNNINVEYNSIQTVRNVDILQKRTNLILKDDKIHDLINTKNVKML